MYKPTAYSLQPGIWFFPSIWEIPRTCDKLSMPGDLQTSFCFSYTYAQAWFCAHLAIDVPWEKP